MENTNTYNLRDMYSYGYEISYSGTFETNIGNLRVSVDRTIRLTTTDYVNGTEVRPVEQYISTEMIDASTNQKVETSDFKISYYDYGNNIIRTLDYDPYEVCDIINTPSPMSAEAKIGDFGISSHLVCNDTYKKTTWKLNAYNSNLATLTYTTKTYNNVDDELKETLTVKKRIDTNGILLYEERDSYISVEGIVASATIASENIDVITYADGLL